VSAPPVAIPVVSASRHLFRFDFVTRNGVHPDCGALQLVCSVVGSAGVDERERMREGGRERDLQVPQHPYLHS